MATTRTRLGSLVILITMLLTVSNSAPANAAGNKYIAVGAGYASSCGLTDLGKVYCWGYNHYGNLGDGTEIERHTPVAVMSALKFVQLSVGDEHSCALTSTGAAYCWGYNYLGQVGNNSESNALVPVAVSGGLRFSKISVGDYLACGIIGGQGQGRGRVRPDARPGRGGSIGADAAAYCWGYNRNGQLGDGTTTNRSTPVRATNMAFASIVPAYQSTCGLTAASAAFCWGRNQNGQLGDGTTIDKSTPTAVKGGLKFTALVAGEYHMCALISTGAAYCWGDNHDGQLGDGTTIDKSTPTAVTGGLKFASIWSGSYSYSTCGLTSTGVAYCWGANDDGQLGDGTEDTDRLTPVLVNTALRFSEIHIDLKQTCGLTTAGAAYCWGHNGNGELGDGTTTNSLTPVQVQ
jgi:hypothetical protein